MHDLVWIRAHPQAFDAACARRGLPPQAAQILDMDRKVRRSRTGVQELQHRRNELTRLISEAKRGGRDAAAEIAEVGSIKQQIATLEVTEREDAGKLRNVLEAIPNVIDDAVPEGADESDNVEMRRWGNIPNFSFEPKDHVDLGAILGGMDFESAARLAGARFVVLSGAMARLERALASFMLDVHTREFGYVEVSAPLLVRPETAYGTGNLPKFAGDLFRTTDDRYLIPTAEMTLTNLVRESIVDEDTLPLRYTSLTPCFRSEAGAAGRDTRGMLRQHQFWKVELVSVTTPENSPEEHQRMADCAETILQRLALPYRVVTLAAGDIGFAARLTWDLEVWLPGQGRWREISSLSNCADFQARRMAARCRTRDTRKTRFVHTLNGSGVAVGRALIAILENFQHEDGSVSIPEVLRPYLGGTERLHPGGATPVDG